MHIVGVVEILAGLAVAFVPRWGSPAGRGLARGHHPQPAAGRRIRRHRAARLRAAARRAHARAAVDARCDGALTWQPAARAVRPGRARGRLRRRGRGRAGARRDGRGTPAHGGRVAVGDVRRQRRRRVRARLLRHAPAGAPAAVGLPAAAARHRLLRRADDVLDPAAGAAADARRRPRGAWRSRTPPRASPPASSPSRPPPTSSGPADERRRGARRGRGRRARGDRALPARRRGVRPRSERLPVGHARGQPERRVPARRAGGGRGRRRRLPHRRHRVPRGVHHVQHVDAREPPAGRGRPAGASAAANLLGSLALGLLAVWLGRELGAML